MAIGKKTGGGSRKGRPNKLTADLKAMILGALDDAGGQAYLSEQAVKNPGAFLTLVGKVLPLQLAGHDGGAIQYQSIDAPAKETREEWLDRHQHPGIVTH